MVVKTKESTDKNIRVAEKELEKIEQKAVKEWLDDSSNAASYVEAIDSFLTTFNATHEVNKDLREKS